MAEINLKDFVSEAITQITDAIIEAQKNNSEKGCVINPKVIQTIGTNNISYMLTPLRDNMGTVSILNFDLIIDASEKTDGGGGLKVRAGFLDIGGDIKREASGSLNNKLTFSIPVSFPLSENK
jgi:hypothetical protein